MTAPSTPVDASLPLWSNDVYFVVEEDSIWRTLNLSEAGAATWEKVFDASTEYTDGTWNQFIRVLCSSTTNLIYAFGLGQKTDQSGSDYTGYILRSANNGETWTYHEIGEATLTAIGLRYSYSGGVTVKASSNTIRPARPLSAGGTCVEEDYKYADINAPSGSTAYCTYDLGYQETATRITARMYFDGNSYVYVSPDNVNWTLVWEYHQPHSSAYCQTKIMNFAIQTFRYVKFYEVQQLLSGDAIRLAWFSWNDSRLAAPVGFDVARTNANWIYVGFLDKIVKSEDGGVNWTTLTSAHGANDICVDPQIAGAIYYWSTAAPVDGNLNLMVAGEIITIAMDTETPARIPCRLARSLNSGKLWTITGGTILKMRENAILTSQKTGLVQGRGLHAYLGDKLIFVDEADIYTSENAGTTITAKKGGWSTYGLGIQVHRLAET